MDQAPQEADLRTDARPDRIPGQPGARRAGVRPATCKANAPHLKPMQLSEVLPYAIGFLLSIAANVVWQFMSTRLPLPSASHSTGISGFWLARVTYKSISDFERYGYNVHRIEENGWPG